MNAPVRSQSVEPDEAGGRLDQWLAQHDERLTRTQAQKLITEGRVLVDGRARPARFKLKAGSEIRWEAPVREPMRLDPDPNVKFGVLYEDDALAVIDKPAGLVVHPAPGHHTGTLVHGMLARLSHLSDSTDPFRPGLVHRLDKDTTGLLVVAKSDSAHQHLQDQLQRRELGRTYQAICWGAPRESEGEIDAPLDRHPRDRKKRAVREGGKPARTRYRRLRDLPGASWLELELDTGRTHQIRVHLAHLGHPVLGDDLYGGGMTRMGGSAPEHRDALRRAIAALRRQALHASRLTLTHPTRGEVMTFESPLPGEFREALGILGVDSPQADG